MTHELWTISESEDGRMIEAWQLSIAAAVGCLAIGVVGLLMNHLWPDSTALNGIFVVGVYYLADGILQRRANTGPHSF